jgi:hypothetical protein
MRTRSGRSRFAVCASLLTIALTLAAAGVARAADDEDDDPFEERIIKKVLGGIGVDVGDRAKIEYRERSPLVIPPNRDLPPPETTESVSHPAWPKDPDQQPKKRAKTKSLDSVGQYDFMKARLSPDQLRGTPGARGSGSTDTRDQMDTTGSNTGGQPLSPEKLGVPSIFNFFSDNKEQAPFVREPDRTSLTQPPPGYQTPSPNYPYGIGQAAAAPSTLEMQQVKDRSAAQGSR